MRERRCPDALGELVRRLGTEAQGEWSRLPWWGVYDDRWSFAADGHGILFVVRSLTPTVMDVSERGQPHGEQLDRLFNFCGPKSFGVTASDVVEWLARSGDRRTVDDVVFDAEVVRRWVQPAASLDSGWIEIGYGGLCDRVSFTSARWRAVVMPWCMS